MAEGFLSSLKSELLYHCDFATQAEQRLLSLAVSSCSTTAAVFLNHSIIIALCNLSVCSTVLAVAVAESGLTRFQRSIWEEIIRPGSYYRPG